MTNTPGRCGVCSKRLTGRQQRWCSQAHAVRGWELEHPVQKAALIKASKAKHKLPEGLRPVLRLRMTDVAQVERQDPNAGLRLREAIAGAAIVLGSIPISAVYTAESTGTE